MQKTLTAYNALVTQPSKNMKGDYTKLLKSMDSMNKKVTEATTKLGAMQGAADTYFQGRGKTIKNIQDQALQLQAQQRAAAEPEGVCGSAVGSPRARARVGGGHHRQRDVTNPETSEERPRSDVASNERTREPATESAR